MAVHERHYQPFPGALTPTWSRFMVIPRYALSRVFSQRFFLIVFIASFIFPLFCGTVIYLHHNLAALQVLELPLEQLQRLFAIDGGFFLNLLAVQARFACVLVLLVGPGLVSADYRNNGLPLYLARPFSRTEYVLGKMSILGFLLALVTLVPSLLLWGMAYFLGDATWRNDWGWVGGSLFAGSLVVMVVLSLLALAVSASLKWKPVAAAALVAMTVVPAALGAMINQLFDTWWGSLLNLVEVFETVFAGLFADATSVNTPVPSAWAALSVLAAVSLWLLWRKVRAYEVVR